MDLFATLSSTTEKQGQAKYLQIFMEIALVFSLTESDPASPRPATAGQGGRVVLISSPFVKIMRRKGNHHEINHHPPAPPVPNRPG